MTTPYKWRQGEDAFSIYVEDEAGLIVADVRPPVVPMTTNVTDAMVEHRRIASLLAAAPDLLRELKNARRQLHANGMTDEEIEPIDAAIKKATVACEVKRA